MVHTCDFCNVKQITKACSKLQFILLGPPTQKIFSLMTIDDDEREPVAIHSEIATLGGVLIRLGPSSSLLDSALRSLQ